MWNNKCNCLHFELWYTTRLLACCLFFLHLFLFFIWQFHTSSTLFVWIYTNIVYIYAAFKRLDIQSLNHKVFYWLIEWFPYIYFDVFCFEIIIVSSVKSESNLFLSVSVSLAENSLCFEHTPNNECFHLFLIISDFYRLHFYLPLLALRTLSTFSSMYCDWLCLNVRIFGVCFFSFFGSFLRLIVVAAVANRFWHCPLILILTWC